MHGYTNIMCGYSSFTRGCPNIEGHMPQASAQNVPKSMPTIPPNPKTFNPLVPGLFGLRACQDMQHMSRQHAAAVARQQCSAPPRLLRVRPHDRSPARRGSGKCVVALCTIQHCMSKGMVPRHVNMRAWAVTVIMPRQKNQQQPSAGHQP